MTVRGPATPTGDLSIRELDTFEELRECVELQETVWGEGFSERAPISLLRVARRLGGVVAGAFDEGGTMVGFVFGLTGLEDGRPVHWSDMLAVRPGLRDGGVGTRLKLFQRARCLERGVRRMYWTYDPLEARNGRLNLSKLGAVAREYVRDMYGPGDSPLHRGLGTDRLVVQWLLDSARVRARLDGTDRPPSPDDVAEVPRAFPVAAEGPLAEPRPEADAPGPGTGGPDRAASALGGAARVVPVPARIQALKDDDPGLAVRWRGAVRAALEEGLDAGLEVTELVRTSSAVHHLLMEPRESAPGEAAAP